MSVPFRIYSASVGSGKTYQLTKKYLKLALGYPQPADPTGERLYAAVAEAAERGFWDLTGSL